MNELTFYRRSAFVVLVIVFVLNGCAPSPAELTSHLLGRWQRVGESSLSEPSVFAEYVEFRPGGQLIELLWDPGPQLAWTINISRYMVDSAGRVIFSGNCWRGQERYLCTRMYAVSQAGTSLRIIDEQDRNKKVQYRRVADLEPEPPPTLAPPFPSPTPAAP